MVFVVLLLMLEAALTVDVFVNQDWEKVLLSIKNNFSNVFVNSMLLYFKVFSSCDTSDPFKHGIWNQDFPKDPSGSFDQFKNFIRSNYDICKWVGLFLVSVQVNLPLLCV